MTALEHVFTFPLPSPPERVFAALTQAEELAVWLAEHAEVEATIGGAYRFWGRGAYGAPTRDAATQTITAFEPPHRFGFRWTLHGQPSEATLTLSPKEGGGSTLTIRHSFARAPGIARAGELIDDLWRLQLGNLTLHLMGRPVALKLDFDDPRPELTCSMLIAAPRAKVWATLIDPEKMRIWLGAPAPAVEPRAGGRISYGWRYEVAGRQVVGGPTKILEIEPKRRLVTDWGDWRGDPDMPVQRITWLLADEAGGTRVTLIHDGFTRAVDISDYGFGWPGFLEQLKGAAES